MQGKPEWKKHETGPFGEYLYTQEACHKLRARLATYKVALREIANITDDRLCRDIALKALEDNT